MEFHEGKLPRRLFYCAACGHNLRKAAGGDLAAFGNMSVLGKVKSPELRPKKPEAARQQGHCYMELRVVNFSAAGAAARRNIRPA